jgi:hypothetical protein
LLRPIAAKSLWAVEVADVQFDVFAVAAEMKQDGYGGLSMVEHQKYVSRIYFI